MIEFAVSETMMNRQQVTIPPIFDAVECNKAEQLQDPLDPLTVEFMLRLPTYMWNCTNAVKKP